MIKCKNCIHNGVCYMQEVCEDIEKQFAEFGCNDFKNAADFERVVRCKDCKYSGMYCFGTEKKARFACLDIEEDGFIRMASAVTPDYYCGGGERKEK